MIAHLFIVSQREPDLYKYLAREFSTEEEVRVIVDRRVGERRSPGGAGAQEPERRRGDRRRQAHVAHQISSLGYAFVRVGR